MLRYCHMHTTAVYWPNYNIEIIFPQFPCSDDCVYACNMSMQAASCLLARFPRVHRRSRRRVRFGGADMLAIKIRAGLVVHATVNLYPCPALSPQDYAGIKKHLLC